MRRLTRLNNAFSKNVENHKHPDGLLYVLQPFGECIRRFVLRLRWKQGSAQLRSWLDCGSQLHTSEQTGELIHCMGARFRTTIP